ncbi:IS30 family transposase [Saccharothrix sp. NRRL B-16348]|uniref:IS30 family transposase n=1 Tax=Saccharothrix sp. NRRL B-16348 TaxID=1415542 RepID=UPI0012FBADAD|nr:IS30 family transposase [Saccharothrix sp. NRRL B-16348]
MEALRILPTGRRLLPASLRTRPIDLGYHEARDVVTDRAASMGFLKALADGHRLREHVQDLLRTKDSGPEQIRRALPLLFPDDRCMRVSHETIYGSLYVQGRGGLHRVLVKTLRTGRSLRRTRRTTERRGRLAGMVNIALRPPEVLDRVVAGHRHGDLITGKENKSAIGTLVERSTGFVMLSHLPNNHGALSVGEARIEAMNRLPRSLRRTLT